MSKRHFYKRFKNVCAKGVQFYVYEDDCKIGGIKFFGGCQGCLKAISKLCDGLTCWQVYNMLIDVKCADKETSCPQEFAKSVFDSFKALNDKRFENEARLFK